MEKRILTAAMLEGFAAHMTEEERSENTRQYYLRVLRELAAFAGTEPVTKQTEIDFKEPLTTSGYTAGTVNTYLSALGSFFDFAGWPELKVRHLKVQPKAYAAPEELRNEQAPPQPRRGKGYGACDDVNRGWVHDEPSGRSHSIGEIRSER